MSNIVLGEGAEEEYSDSYQWYYQRSPDAAVRFESEFAKALKLIADNPDRFPCSDKLHRFCLMKNFPFQLIFRKVESDRVLVVALGHTSRRPGYWKGRSE